MSIAIVYPERRYLSDELLMAWYVDAVLNGDCPGPDWFKPFTTKDYDDAAKYEDVLERLLAVDLSEAALALDDAGVITLAQGWDLEQDDQSLDS